RSALVEMVAHLKMKPMCVASARLALVALEAAKRAGEPFRLALLDLNMPEGDGLTLSEWIRENPELRDTRLAILTSAGLRGDAERCARIGVDTYLFKPIKESELARTVTGLLATERSVVKSRPSPLTLPSSRESTTGLRILVAEDNAVNQKLALRLLEKEGHSVV